MHSVLNRDSNRSPRLFIPAIVALDLKTYQILVSRSDLKEKRLKSWLKALRGVASNRQTEELAKEKF